VKTLAEVGQWLHQYGESLYGTRGGPVTPRPWGVTTQAGKRVYIHVLDWPDDRLFVPLKGKIRSARLLRDGSAIAIHARQDGIELAVPPAADDEWDRIIRVERQ
jgi:alpha-L-fucosidase